MYKLEFELSEDYFATCYTVDNDNVASPCIFDSIEEAEEEMLEFQKLFPEYAYRIVKE